MAQPFKITTEVEARGTKKTAAELDAVDKKLNKLEKNGTIKSVVDSAKADFGSLEGIATKVGGSITVPFAAAATVIAGAGVAAVGLGTALFSLAQNAADYAGTIWDATEKTGLGAETLSALRFGAEATGTTFETVEKAIAKFSKTVGAAADGSKQAAADLERFGITPQEAINDLDGSLTKVFQSILNARKGVEQMDLAQRAFGKSGAELLPFLNFFDGDLKQLVERAKELGLTLSDEAAYEADQFGEQLDILKLQIGGAARTIGMEFIPTFAKMATDVSSWLKDNKGEIKSWAEAFSGSIKWLANDLQLFMADLALLRKDLEWLASYTTLGGSHSRERIAAEREGLANNRRLALARRNNPQEFDNDLSGTRDPSMNASRNTDWNYSGDIEKAKAEADKLRREREAMQRSELSAQIQLYANQISKLEALYTDNFKALAEKFKEEALSPGAYKEAFRELTTWFEGQLLETLPGWNSLIEEQAIKDKKVGSERELIAQQGQARIDALYQKSADFQKQLTKELAESAKKNSADQLKAEIELLQRKNQVFVADQTSTIARLKKDAAVGVITDGELFNVRQELERRALAERESMLRAELRLVKGNAAEEMRVRHELALTLIEIDTQTYEHQREAIEKNKQLQKEAADEAKRWADESLRQWQQTIEAQDRGSGIAGGFKSGLGLDGPSIFDPNVVGGFKSEADYMAEVAEDMNKRIGQSLADVTNGIIQMGIAWLATGEFSAQAMLQMVGSAALNLAAEASMRAIMEIAHGAAQTAKAAAATASGNVVAAALHTKAAAGHYAAATFYGKVGGVAAAIGIGASLAGRAVGGGGEREDQSNSPDYYTSPPNMSTSNNSLNQQALELRFDRFTTAIDNLNSKLDSASPGDVLQRGLKQSPGIVADSLHTDLKRNGTQVRQIGQILNVR